MLKIQLKIHAFILKWLELELGHENKTLSVETGGDGGGLVYEVIAQKRV